MCAKHKGSVIQTHHISYDPEITIDILKSLHQQYHKHWTGLGKGEQNTSYNKTIISFRIPRGLRKIMNKMVLLGGYINEPDFIRETIREKIQHDAPYLIKEMFERKEE